MYTYLQWISEGGLWFAQFLYVICYIPQIIENHRQKSGRGVSDLMLLGYYVSLIALMYYVFFCDLPVAYKLLPPLQIVAVLVLILQRLLYEDFSSVRLYWFLYGISILGSFVFLPLAVRSPLLVGLAAGWVMFIVSCINQIPQMIKIFQEKSVKGFSLLFVFIVFIAACIELSASWLLGLPIQTLVTAFRALLVSVIWLVQFWLYRSHA